MRALLSSLVDWLRSRPKIAVSTAVGGLLLFLLWWGPAIIQTAVVLALISGFGLGYLVWKGRDTKCLRWAWSFIKKNQTAELALDASLTVGLMLVGAGTITGLISGALVGIMLSTVLYVLPAPEAVS